ncbi:MAG: RIP metalloprotease RseP [Anaerolineae bacterium]|nr:RIP metalloprotease RseP [Anaerolineae bacterium]
MNDFVLAALSFFIVLIPLVIIHELGHFFAAKSVGVTVLEFGIGIPPRALVLFRKGDTIYTLNWIPLGGFVRPYGEDFVRPKTEEEMKEDRAEIEGRHIENPKSVFEAGPWERIWFLFAGPLANFIAALVLFIVIAGFFQPYEIGDITMIEILPGSPAETAGLEAGDVVTHVDGQKVERLDEFEDAIEDKDSIELTVNRGGETQTLTVTPAPFQTSDIKEKVQIVNIEEDAPAHEAGLEIDDVVVAVDDQPLTDVDMLVDYTKEHEDIPIDLTIQRGDEIINIEVTPRVLDGEDVARIGIQIAPAPLDETIGAVTATRDLHTEVRKADNVVEAIQTGSGNFVRAIGVIFYAPVMLIRGDIEAEQARPAGPVAISQMGGKFIKESQEESNPYPILGFAAIISIALAVTNLLPIPALDGGRILFVVIELLRGKPISPEREGVVHMIGMLFLLSLMVVIVFFDIVKPIDLSSF